MENSRKTYTKDSQIDKRSPFLDLKRTKTLNHLKKIALKNLETEKKEGKSNSFCYDKKTPEEKINNMKLVLNNTQNELFEALAAEFKLKENMIGLEKHALKLEIENKILQKNRRQSLNTLTVIQQVMNELNNLKTENTNLILQSKQVREGAIDALVEKERKIIELSEEIHNTEQFYKEQFDQACEEIKLLQKKNWNMDLITSLSIEKQKTFDLEANLENERKELLKRIRYLELELEEKERENKQNLMNLEKNLNEDNEKKINEQLKIMVERDNNLYSNSFDILVKAEEKSNHYEVICLNLEEKLKSLEIVHLKEIAEFKQKNEQIQLNHEELIVNLKNLFEKQIDEVKRESQRALMQKNEYIIQQEKSKDNLLKRINELEAENNKKLKENDKLLDSIHTLTQQNSLVQNRLEEVASKQEDYIMELKNKFISEKQMLNFELRHMKKLTMDDSSLVNPKKNVPRSFTDLGRKHNKEDEKRTSIKIRPNYLQNLLAHSTSLGMELLNNKEPFEFPNQNITNQNSKTSNKNSKKNSRIMQEEELGSELHTKSALSLNLFSTSKKVISKRNFSIPDEPNEYEGVLKEMSSVSDLSGFSSKVLYCDKAVQVNRENETFLEMKNSKDDVFLVDYDLCNDDVNKNSKIVQKIKINKEKFNDIGNKTLIKNDSKFFLMENDDSDDSDKSRHKIDNCSLKLAKDKSDKKLVSDYKNTREFYLEDFEKKLTSVSNLMNDFLRNFKENQKNAMVFDSSKKNKFLKIHTTLSTMLKKLNRDHYIITHELLKKTMIKMDSQTLKTLNYHKLMKLIFEGYSKKNEGFIEYNIILEDVLMKKSWRFQIRYSKLRNFHKECQAFLSSIKLDENFIGSLPPFPSKKWFGNTEDEFIKSRLKDLKIYFQTIMTSPLCIQIIEKGILRYFLYKEIWKFESEDLKGKCEQIEKWDSMMKNSLINLKEKEKNNEENYVNYEKLALLMKEEIEKICLKLENVQNDLDILEKNDSFSILRYEEKRKELEKEFSVRESFDEKEF